MITTLNEIRKHRPCTTSLENGLAYLGKTQSDDEPIDLMTILDVMGVADTVWCFRLFPGLDLREFALALAETVAHLDRSGTAQLAINAGRAYLAGTGSLAAARAARTAAWAAADDAAYAVASAAAWAVAYDAATRAATRAAYAAYAAVSAAKGDPVLLAEQRQLVEQFIKENS